MQALAVKTTGERIVFYTGWGSTETAPTSTGTYWDTERVGLIGLPFPGVELKMVPCGSKYELRLRGINVTPGYFGQPDLTKKMFDEEGFYCIGDAGVFVDENDPLQGIIFAGRVVEDFKLTTGTFVHVGSLRTDAIAAATPVVHDALVAGQDREFIGLLAWPNLHACRQVVGNVDATFEDVIRHPEVIACLKRGLEAHNATCTGSSMRVARAMDAKVPKARPTADRIGVLEELLNERYSVRAFLPREVPRETIEHILMNSASASGCDSPFSRTR